MDLPPWLLNTIVPMAQVLLRAERDDAASHQLYAAAAEIEWRANNKPDSAYTPAAPIVLCRAELFRVGSSLRRQSNWTWGHPMVALLPQRSCLCFHVALFCSQVVRVMMVIWVLDFAPRILCARVTFRWIAKPQECAQIRPIYPTPSFARFHCHTVASRIYAQGLRRFMHEADFVLRYTHMPSARFW